MKKMKLFSLMFLFAMVGTMFTGCSSDDDDNDGNELVGYWLRYDDNDQYMEEFGFFADGTCNYTESYEPDDDSDNLEPEYDFGEGTYTVKGNKLIMRLTFGDETETWTYTIKSVKSKKQLILKDDEGDTYTFGYYKK